MTIEKNKRTAVPAKEPKPYYPGQKKIKEPLTNFPIEEAIKRAINDLSPFKHLKIRLGANVYIGDFQFKGWREPLPFYAFRCKIHGIVADYLHGHPDREYMRCPECLEENRK